MKKEVSPLFSQYILEGVQMEETPFSALYDCLDGNGSVDVPEGPFQDIIDEYLDKSPSCCNFNLSLFDIYCQTILRTASDRNKVNLYFPVSWTLARIDNLLLESLFKNGHFTISDIMLIAKWDWNNAPAGNLAAFYDSTVTAGHYLYDLGIKLDRYFVESNRKECRMDLSMCGNIPSKRKCGDKAVPGHPDSSIVYIPFCQSKFQLGGSALSELFGNGSGVEADLYDPDYFLDCFEVVRELVEDGIVMAGIPVSRGGLGVAAEKFRGRNGISLDLSGIMSATMESDPVRLLFSELPGVLLQIGGSDMDYIDSQFLLQEIAYYPIGEVSGNFSSVKINSDNHSSLSSILSSLLLKAGSEEN